MSVKLLTEHHLEFLSLKEGFTGSSESTLVKMPHCWISHVVAHIISSFENSVDPDLDLSIKVWFISSPEPKAHW